MAIGNNAQKVECPFCYAKIIPYKGRDGTFRCPEHNRKLPPKFQTEPKEKKAQTSKR